MSRAVRGEYHFANNFYLKFVAIVPIIRIYVKMAGFFVSLSNMHFSNRGGVMKKIILVLFLAVVLTTPCLAAIEPDEVGSIDGTAWRAVDRDDLDFAFYDGALYANCAWIGITEGDCESGELLPMDSVIRETGRIGFSIHLSSPFCTHIFRFEVVDLEGNKGSMQLWYIELWPFRLNPLFLFSPELIDGDKLFGVGIYRHYIYSSSWEDVTPIVLFKVDDEWVPPGE